MRSKFAIPALVLACTFGAMTVASAQENTTAQPSKQAAAPTAKMKTHHKKTAHKMKPGSTTGMSRGTSASPSNSNKQSGSY
jgi:hypothetical protein